MPRIAKKIKQIPDIILDYLDFCNYKNLSLKTTKSYHQTLMLFESYLREEKNIVDIRKVDKKVVEEYITFTKERGKYSYITSDDAILKAHQDSRSDIGNEISEATLNNYLRNIKVFFTYLEDNSIILENRVKQCKFIKAPRNCKEQLTDYEYQKLIKSIDITKFHEYRDYIITNLIFDTGMRLGETLSLTINDIDLTVIRHFISTQNTRIKAN